MKKQCTKCKKIKNISEFKKCWALENLQPLWKEENLSKGAKYGNK